MKILLYNTCPHEFEKKLKKIRRELFPEQKAGKVITEERIEEDLSHKKTCYNINDKTVRSGPRKKAACKTCEHWANALGRRTSDLTMRITLEEAP